MNEYGKTDEREPNRRDPPRLRLKELLRSNDISLAAGHRLQPNLSLAVGKPGRARGARIPRYRDPRQLLE